MMSKLPFVQLYRKPSTDQGTFGYLVVDGEWWHSLELPDRDNKPNISCIPKGEYLVTRRYSPTFKKELYWVRNVPNRSFILIHSANFAGDESKGWQTHLQGCIALGKRLGEYKNKYGRLQKCVSLSRQAVREFEMFMDYENFKLEIKDLYGNYS